MYRIEFEPGDVGVFRSVEELATAVKSGMITSRARIYHQASDKWLPIEFHPHYRKALEMVASGNIPTTPPAPRPAVQLPVAMAAATVVDPAPLTEPAPVAVEAQPEPAPIEPYVAPGATEPLLESAPAAPPEVFVPPRSPEIRFIPLDDPAHRRAEPAPPIKPRFEPPEPLEPLEPLFEPLEPSEVALEAPTAAEMDVSELTEEPAQQNSEPAPASGSAFYTPEESSRPAFGPRFRLGLSGKPGRPIAIAIAGAALIISTASTSSLWRLDLLSAGSPSLSFPRREAPRAEARASAPAAAPAARRTPEPQGSPSFGASSAFVPASHATPGDAKPEASAERAPTTPPPQESRAAADTVIVRAPRATDIAVAAAKIPGLAPAVNGKLTLPVLITRYEAAYTAAQQELETGIRTAGFANLFAPEHLSSAQGVRATRLSTGTASAYIAKFHRREAEIEAAYADSAASLVKSPADRKIWDGRHILQESPEVTKLSGFLLQQIDSVFGVLSSQDGAYEIRDGSIAFQDASAAHAYAELRPWLDRGAHQWADTASGTPTTAARVLRAIGNTRLPQGAAL